MTAKLQKINPSNFNQQDRVEGGDCWKKVSKAICKAFLRNSQKNDGNRASPIYSSYEICKPDWNSVKKGDVSCLI